MKKSQVIIIEDLKAMGSPRPRFARMGRFVRTYMPKKYEEYKNILKIHFRGREKHIEPLKVDIEVTFKPQKSWSKKKKIEMLKKPHVQKPDVDNIGKSILDAMNGIIFEDDKQVYDLHIRKTWDAEDTIIIKTKE